MKGAAPWHAFLCAAVTLVATLAASAAAGAVVAGLVSGVAAGIVAGAVVFVIGNRGLPDTTPAADVQLKEALTANSQLRHDIRGALSPALLVSDRLTGHADPGVVKAGNIVVRAVERATDLLETNKREDAARLPAPPAPPSVSTQGVSPPVR